MKDFYVQSIGLEEEGVSRILQKATEFLRMAHMIARGIETGESKGRAARLYGLLNSAIFFHQRNFFSR